MRSIDDENMRKDGGHDRLDNGEAERPWQGHGQVLGGDLIMQVLQ